MKPETYERVFYNGVAILVFAAVFLGVELFNGTPPSLSALKPMTGKVRDIQVSRTRERTSNVVVQLTTDSSNAILFQELPGRLVSAVLKVKPGDTVLALISTKSGVDRETGMVRHSMWQLAIEEVLILSYDEVVEFHTSRVSYFRNLAYLFTAAGLVCLVIGKWRNKKF